VVSRICVPSQVVNAEALSITALLVKVRFGPDVDGPEHQPWMAWNKSTSKTYFPRSRDAKLCAIIASALCFLFLFFLVLQLDKPLGSLGWQGVPGALRAASLLQTAGCGEGAPKMRIFCRPTRVRRAETLFSICILIAIAADLRISKSTLPSD
jgi:hypothetical protein